MAQIVSVATALANETTGVTLLMGNALLASVSNAIDAGLLGDKGEAVHAGHLVLFQLA